MVVDACGCVERTARASERTKHGAVLRDEQIMLRKSINKRREKDGLEPVPLDLAQYRKEVLRSVSAKKS
jgi:protein involved in sex pheromone biosynthesis